MTQRTLTNSETPFSYPNAQRGDIALRFTLLGPDQQTVLPVLSADDAPMGAVQVLVDDMVDGVFSISLQTTDTTTPETIYRVEMWQTGLESDHRYHYEFLATLPTGPGDLQWSGFFTPGPPLDPGEWTAFLAHAQDQAGMIPAGRHLPDGATDGQFARWDGAAGAWVAVTIGGGDHADLTGRDAADQHPVGAVTGLQTALDGKSSTGHDHTGVYDPAGSAGAVQAELETHRGGGDHDGRYLAAVVDDLTPDQGGPSRSMGHSQYITDNTGVIIAAIAGATTGVRISEADATGLRPPGGAGVKLKAGSAIFQGQTLKIEQFAGDYAGNFLMVTNGTGDIEPRDIGVSSAEAVTIAAGAHHDFVCNQDWQSTIYIHSINRDSVDRIAEIWLLNADGVEHEIDGFQLYGDSVENHIGALPLCDIRSDAINQSGYSGLVRFSRIRMDQFGRYRTFVIGNRGYSIDGASGMSPIEHPLPGGQFTAAWTSGDQSYQKFRVKNIAAADAMTVEYTLHGATLV